MRRALGAVTALWVAFGGIAAQAETLADAMVLAYRHSGLLEKNRALLRAADEDVAQAIAQLRPIVNYTVQAARTYVFPNDEPLRGIENDFEDTASIGLSANLLLYDGGASKLAIDVARETVLSLRESLTAVEQQVLTNAVAAYLAVREAQAFVSLRESNVGLIGQELQAARERFDVGEVTRTDVALAESQLAASRSNLAQALGDLQTARAQYVQTTGRQPGTLAPAGRLPKLPASLSEAQAVARRSHPAIRADMRNITISELNVLRAEAAIRPSVSGTANLGIDQSGTEQLSLGLSMQGPIYQGGAISSAYRQAVARRDENRADLHVTTDDVLNQVAQAWARIEVSRARIVSGELQIRAAQVAFNGLQEEVRLGARTTLDVLQAEQDLQDARAGLISSQIAEFQAAYGLLASMGLLTVEHLGLGIPTYDPNAYYNAVKDAPARRVSPQGQKLDRLIGRFGRN